MTSYAPGTPSWVDLGTPDVDGAAAFYAGLLGWDVQDGAPETGGYRMCQLRGRAAAGLGPQQSPDMPPFWTCYVTVADADATTARARDLGGAVLVEPMDVMTFGRMAVLADPAGAAFSIWQAGDHIGCEVVNEPGAFCWSELLTTDVEGSAAFYGGLFGWEARTAEGDMPYTELHLDGRGIAGMMPKPPGMPAEAPPMWMVYFAVADVDAATARVPELGGAVLMPIMDSPAGRFATVADPAGAAFYLIDLAAGLGG
ncbi:MAG: VOC family protein [Acidimicrobiales bacterium]